MWMNVQVLLVNMEGHVQIMSTISHVLVSLDILERNVKQVN